METIDPLTNLLSGNRKKTLGMLSKAMSKAPAPTGDIAAGPAGDMTALPPGMQQGYQEGGEILTSATNWINQNVLNPVKNFANNILPSLPQPALPTATPAPATLGTGLAAQAGSAAQTHNDQLKQAAGMGYAEGGEVKPLIPFSIADMTDAARTAGKVAGRVAGDWYRGKMQEPAQASDIRHQTMPMHTQPGSLTAVPRVASRGYAEGGGTVADFYGDQLGNVTTRRPMTPIENYGFPRNVPKAAIPYTGAGQPVGAPSAISHPGVPTGSPTAVEVPINPRTGVPAVRPTGGVPATTPKPNTLPAVRPSSTPSTIPRAAATGGGNALQATEGNALQRMTGVARRGISDFIERVNPVRGLLPGGGTAATPGIEDAMLTGAARTAGRGLMRGVGGSLLTDAVMPETINDINDVAAINARTPMMASHGGPEMMAAHGAPQPIRTPMPAIAAVPANTPVVSPKPAVSNPNAGSLLLDPNARKVVADIAEYNGVASKSVPSEQLKADVRAASNRPDLYPSQNGVVSHVQMSPNMFSKPGIAAVSPALKTIQDKDAAIMNTRAVPNPNAGITDAMVQRKPAGKTPAATQQPADIAALPKQGIFQAEGSKPIPVGSDLPKYGEGTAEQPFTHDEQKGQKRQGVWGAAAGGDEGDSSIIGSPTSMRNYVTPQLPTVTITGPDGKPVTVGGGAINDWSPGSANEKLVASRAKYRDEVQHAVEANATQGIAPSASQVKILGLSGGDVAATLAANNIGGRFNTAIATNLEAGKAEGQKALTQSEINKNNAVAEWNRAHGENIGKGGMKKGGLTPEGKQVYFDGTDQFTVENGEHVPYSGKVVTGTGSQRPIQVLNKYTGQLEFTTPQEKQADPGKWGAGPSDPQVKAWTQNEKYYTANADFVNTIGNFGKKVQDIMKQYNLNDLPKLGNYTLQQLVKLKGMSSGDVSALNNMLAGYRGEMSKMAEGNLGIGGAKEATAKKYADSISDSMPLKEFITMSQWAEKEGAGRLDSIQKETTRLKKSLGIKEKQQEGRTIVRTGTLDGKKVIQYSDGTVEYAS
jgi:hypothetical protein